jgi:AcrR family transcriptional regulator
MTANTDHRGHSAASLTELAVALTREVGLDGLTLRAFARRAGVSPGVVYHHIGDLDAVRFAVADTVVAMIEIPPPPAAPGEWRRWLERLARNGYEVIGLHPGVYGYIARNGPSSPNQVLLIDAAMQVLSGAGLSDEDAAYSYSAFISHVGAAADLAAIFALQADRLDEIGARFERNISNVAALHPGVLRALPSFVSWDHERACWYTLDLILDGIERRLETHPGRR